MCLYVCVLGRALNLLGTLARWCGHVWNILQFSVVKATRCFYGRRVPEQVNGMRSQDAHLEAKISAIDRHGLLLQWFLYRDRVSADGSHRF